MRTHPQYGRRGTILPLLALTVVGLFTFVALAIDLGMLTIVRTNCQNAADAGALAGCRQLNNKPNAVSNDSALAVSMATNTATGNKTLEKSVTSTNLATITKSGNNYVYVPAAPKVGLYQYNGTTQKFVATFPASKASTESWTAMKVNVSQMQSTFFANVLGVQTMPASAVAVAVHRPRDVALVLDFSGSMQFGSQFSWNPGWGGSTGSSYGMLNADSSYPQFGHYQRYKNYSTTSTVGANQTSGTITDRPNPMMMRSSYTLGSGEVCATANLTVETGSGPPMILDFRFDNSNLSNPATKVTTVNTANLWSAFNRWMTVPPTAENMLADTAYKPPVTGQSTVSVGTGSAVIRTFDFAGYDAYDTTNTKGPVPAPDNFIDQSDTPIKYVGDKHPRRGGAKPADVSGAAADWSPTAATGAATSAQDLLGYLGSNAYNRTAATPTTPTVLGTYGNAWTNFRDTVWETNGYDLDVAAYDANRATVNQRTTDLFQGFSMGPAYYGKTFFMWPPDPRYNTSADESSPNTTAGNGAKDSSGRWMADWRRRFFLKSDGTQFDPQAVDNDPVTTGNQSINQALLNGGTGAVLNTGNTFRINYSAVLKWIKTGPQVLPPNLRAGRIVYYTSIPDGVGSASTDKDQLFWREYIDFVLGFTGNTSRYNPDRSLAGRELASWPEGVTVSMGATAKFGTNPYPYMNYTDNPNRPRMHFWFGPYTMMAFLSARISGSDRHFGMAGTVHEAQCWQLKAAMNSALDDIRNNHPNDSCGMAFFAYSNYKTVRVPTGQKWARLKNSLFYPSTLVNAISDSGNLTSELSPYDSSLNTNGDGIIPNANGSTDPGTGFALAYNLLSSYNYNTTTSEGGRRGASKIVVFETDGVPNSSFSLTYNANGNNSSYTIGGAGTSGQAAAESQTYAVIDKMMLAPAATGNSGFNAAGAPCRVHAIAFGDLFSISPLTTPGGDALDFLGTVQYKGKTQATDTRIAASNIVTGDYSTRINTLKALMQRIMQSGIQVTLIE
jgi:hypothetical protein